MACGTAWLSAPCRSRVPAQHIDASASLQYRGRTVSAYRLYLVLPRNGLPFVFHRFVRSHGTKSTLRTSPGDEDRIGHAASCFPFGIQHAIAPVPWQAMRTNAQYSPAGGPYFLCHRPEISLRNVADGHCGVGHAIAWGVMPLSPTWSLTDIRPARPSTGCGRACVAAVLVADPLTVWNQPYLETCCRAALHRLYLSGPAGRPAGQMDEPCQYRLEAMGL